MNPLDTDISTVETAKALGLSSGEYAFICRKLERKPNFAELGIFSAMYSEHCSYKSSKPMLKRFPTTGRRVLQGPGENAGIVDIGDGWAVAFKMESHNHPSFIEPYQGAATGVGGILRDIFTMGARPIASMDALFFGGDSPKTRSLVKGVVKGIGDYGNSVGVPTVAGMTYFHPTYSQNCLVNAFSLGLIRSDQIYRGVAQGVGNLVVYVGAKTGRDGVHGATMASKEFCSEVEAERPTVQVGDPFTEKLLMEASLEVMRQGLVIGIQDMGAAGLTSSSFEMAHRAGTGLVVDLDKIPARELNMSGYELLLSESQERMLLVTDADRIEALRAVFEKWDLHAEVVGEVVQGSRVKMRKNAEWVVDLPIDLVVNPPLPERPKAAPSDQRQRWFMDRNRMLVAPVEAKFQVVLSDPSFGDPGPIVQQYDSMVGNRTEGGAVDDAAVIRVRDIENRSVRLVLSADCNPRVCWLSPREGGRRAVLEAATNLAMRGATPIGITDCLNFGSPENPEVMWQFDEAIEGICEACQALEIPVVSGNVSFYNDTDSKPIHPTPVVGMVGLIEDRDPLPESNFFDTGLEIALLGNVEGGLGGSVMAAQWFKRDCGQPDDTDIGAVTRMLRLFSRVRKVKVKYGVHDISEGGLVTALLEMVIHGRHDCTGVELTVPFGVDLDRFLFGETIPRVVLAFDSSDREEFERMANQAGVPFTLIGQVNDTDQFHVVQGKSTTLLSDMKKIRETYSQKWKSLIE